MAELAERAGVPKGVFSVVTGGAAAIGGGDDIEPNREEALLHWLDRDRQAADGAVRRHREKGRRWSSAATRPSSYSTMPISTRRSKARCSKFRNTGQTCVCANRLLVQDGVYDAFAEKLAGRVAAIKVGNGVEAG